MMNLIVILILFLSSFIFAQKGYPVPNKTNNLLFYIQHSANHNTFVYEYNASNPDKPIVVNRINYEENGERNPLTIIQKKFAYGINFLNSKKDQFVLAAKKDFPLYLKSSKSAYYVEIIIKNQKIKLDKIFLQIEKGTSGLNTKIDYMIIYGKNENGKSIEEKLDL